MDNNLLKFDYIYEASYIDTLFFQGCCHPCFLLEIFDLVLNRFLTFLIHYICFCYLSIYFEIQKDLILSFILFLDPQPKSRELALEGLIGIQHCTMSDIDTLAEVSFFLIQFVFVICMALVMFKTMIYKKNCVCV